MTSIDPVPTGDSRSRDALEAALAALDRGPGGDLDDGFTAAVMARLDAEAAADGERAAQALARLAAGRRRERRLRRYGLAGTLAGAAGLVVVAGAGLVAGPAGWTPLAVFALGLTTAVAAWLVAGPAA